MKIIEILKKIANGEIEKGTKLWLEECSFNFNGDSFTNEQYPFGNSSFLSTRFLNKEVELIPPKPKKYYLRLYEDDSFSYINKNKIGCTDYKTKFTQEEIDESMLLKFIEQHGIKEEAE